MAAGQRDSSRSLRLSGVPAWSEAPVAGGAHFVAYCMSGEVRADQRRVALSRARAAHRRAVGRHQDPYLSALVLAQRLGVALEDLARLLLAFEALDGGDPFEAFRTGRLQDFDEVYSRLTADPEALRHAVRLPAPDDTTDLEPALRAAVLEASDALARRWLDHLRDAAAGWLLLRRIAKSMRHGTPLLPRELVLGPPGAGALGRGLEDSFDRWVLLLDTEVDQPNRALETAYVMADISERTLARGYQAGLNAVAMAREVTAAHVHRVTSQSKWAMPRHVLKLVGRDTARVLKEHSRD